MPEDSQGHHGDLLVCGTCGEVKGKVPSPTEDWSQLCSCTPGEVRSAQPRYRDFNRWVELCYCCGLDAVPSGSRWSRFHCETCGKRVRALNQMVGRCVIPIGRHSIMNGISLANPARRTHEAFVAFADQAQTLFATIDELSDWAAARVLFNLATLGCEKRVDVYLDNYLAEVKRRRLSRSGAFNSLVEQIFGPEDGKLLVSLCRPVTS